MSDRVKVLFIISSLESGGKERQCLELIKGLCEKEVSCELVLLKDQIAFTEIHHTCCTLHLLNKQEHSKYQIYRQLKQIAMAAKPDFIQSWDTQSSVYAALVSLFSKASFINYSIQYAKKVHFFSKHGLSAAFGFIFSKTIIANSEAGLSAHFGVSKGICIKNGYDLNRASQLRPQADLTQELSLDFDHVIGMVGNFLPAKDHKTLVISIQRLLEKGHRIGGIMIGQGPTLDAIKKLIKPEYNEHFRFLAGKTNVEEYINLFDIHCLICNTRGHAEGISNAIMEGMVMGKPVVATDSGGNKELVVDGHTGYIVTPFDVAQLEQKLELLLKDETLRLKLGATGKKRIADVFSQERFVNDFMKLYTELN